MTRTSLLVVVGLVAACRGRGDERAAAPPPPPPRPADAASVVAPVVAIDAAPAAVAPVDASALRTHMTSHFDAVARIQQALIRGELDQARDDATYLIEHDEHASLDAWQSYVQAMRAAATQVKAAPDLASAARRTADLGLQCSLCHTARSAIVAFAWEPLPAADATVATRMRRHAWGAARLWEGLIGPSDDLWNLGAEVMTSTELEALVVERMDLDHEARDLIDQVQILARRAPAATTAEARAALHGELFVLCTACHQRVRDHARSPAAP